MNNLGICTGTKEASLSDRIQEIGESFTEWWHDRINGYIHLEQF